MGRAIAMETRQDDFDRRLRLVEDALEELAQNGTRIHHVDLMSERNVRAEGIEVTPDEEFTSPTTRKRKKAKATT